MNLEVLASFTLHKEAKILFTPACLKPRYIPKTPSSEWNPTPVSHADKTANSVCKYSGSPHITDKHMRFSPPPANASGGYTLI